MLLLTGCSPGSSNAFYWGDYSSTLYALKKNPGEESLKKHKEELLLIISRSDQRKLNVPPGIYAEYGYILIKEGNEDDGMIYLDKEMALYPESVIFITRLKDEYKRSGSDE
jgi:hypothetical protein